MSGSFYSPLRYPGGKNRLSKFIAKVCKDNNINGHYIEPFAGGASVALYLLMNNIVEHITINDYDRAIYAFWHSVVNRTDELCKMIEERCVNIDTWRQCRAVMDSKDLTENLLELGYATLFLNRTNYSGVLKGGVIGGREQTGKYKIDCRFNKKNIINKIKAIGARRNDITLTNLDSAILLNNISSNEGTLIYLDPPYYDKGKYLYMNYFKLEDHKKLGKKVMSISDVKWIVSYDNVSDINNIYKGVDKITYGLAHTVNKTKVGEEVMFFAPGLKVDKTKHPVNDYRGWNND